MRKIIFLPLLIAVNCFFCHSQVKYDTQNSTEIKRIYIKKGNKVIDSVPNIRDFIKDYSFKRIDTVKVLYSNPAAALKYARKILDNKYGKEKMDLEEPFKMTLIDSKFWFMRGSLPEGYVGGTALILISKYDGDVLLLTHGK